MTSIELDDANIWDDSALIRSWDQALEEYKHYHSIHARGEKVYDVLEEHLNKERKDFESEPQDGEDQSVAMSEGLEPGEAITEGTQASEVNGFGEQANEQTSAQHPATVPSTLLAGQDPVLQNLVMSWYWTGYYSGLHASKSAAKPQSSADKVPQK